MSDIIILEDSKNNAQQNSKNEFVKKKDLMQKLNDIVMSFQSLKIKEKVIFYRLLSVMLNSGMTLIKSIEVLEKQEKNKLIKTMYLDFLTKLKEGKTLSECIAGYPQSFSNSELGMIKSGEKTGKLNESLLIIAEQVEKISTIVTKLKGALIYPAMILIVVISVIIIMMVVVVPKLLAIFESKSSLPASTRMLVAMSDFVVSYWYLIIIGSVLFYIILTLWKQTESGKFIFDNLKVSIPKFGQIYKQYILSKFARNFSSLVFSGVSIVESLKISADAIGNEVYRQRILLLTEDVKAGIKIWESIDGDPLFPDMMVQMIQVGEQTATLDKTIIKVADFYDEQFDTVVSTINKLIEPLIIIFLAVTVGFIAVGIMQPIMGLADQISTT